MNKFFRLTGYSLTTSILSYSFNLYLATKLGLEDFGLYTLAVFYASILLQLALFGTNELVVRYLHENEGYIHLILKLRFAVMGALGISLLIATFITDNDIYLLVLANLLTGFGFPGVFEYLKKQELYAKIFLIQRCLFFCSVVVLFGVTDVINLRYILFLLFVIDLISNILQVQFFYRIGFHKSHRLTYSRIITEGKDVLLFSLAKMSLNASIRYIIPVKLGLAMLSIFSLSWQFVTFTSLLYTQVTRIFRPKIYGLHETKQNFDPLIRRYTFALLSIGACVSIIVYLFGAKVLAILLPNEEVDYGIYIPFVSASIFLAAFDSLANVLIVMLNKVKFLRNLYFSVAIFVIFFMIFYDFLFSDLFEFVWTLYLTHVIALALAFIKVFNEISTKTRP
ncbi:MAG: hypothetical protein HWE12_15495 [Oceanospirillaceae bacterium]|nr:hypothetical protein [Oceanospirillaceae bacterium]